jgi:hypothetical protein
MPLDPLLQGVDLPLRLPVFPLGFPLELATNSPAVIECARSSWEEYPQLFDERPLRMRVIVEPGDPPVETLLPAVYRAQGHLFTVVCDRANQAVCDLERGIGAAWLNENTTSDPGYLRFYVLEAMAYATLTSLHLTAIHAACVAIDGRGILLCGRSGAGKTSLAYACARRGFAYVTDDVASLVRKRGDRMVLGKPFHFQFREDAGDLFPELRGRLAEIAPHGKPSIEVKSPELGVQACLQCRVEAIAFLQRGEANAVCLKPIGQEEARQRLAAELPILTPQSHEEQLRSLDVLMAAGAFELRYQDLDEAVERLRALIEERA